MIEVEKKFVFTDDTVNQLLQAGATSVKEIEFTDKYYDTEDFKMTLADHWLRQQNGKWQLKCPVAGLSSNSRSHLYGSVYHEVIGTDDILELLRPLLESSSACMNNKDLVNFLEHYKCNVFAVIRTCRRSYCLDGFVIDLDCTESGFQVGEIEVMVSDEDDVPEARNRIKLFAEKMGFCIADQIPGKMDMHLREHFPLHYKALLQSKILHTCE